MIEIKKYPLIRHFRAEPTAHILRYRHGRLVGKGQGLTFWFLPVNTQAAAVPLNDQELPFLFHARSGDFQQLTVQGVITFRFADPPKTAERIDFTLDLDNGHWGQAPLEQVNGLLTQTAQQDVIDEVAHLELRAILTEGVAPMRSRIADGLAAETSLAEMGIEVVAVRVAAVTPAAELEKALQQPTREAIQEEADAATFTRRAQAVEKESAIAENELANRIELARREEALVKQHGANEQLRVEEETAAGAITAKAQDYEERMRAKRQADAVKELEEVHLHAEHERADIQEKLGPQVLMALALRELAGEVGKIEHLTITPELITPLLARLNAGAPEA